MEKIGERFWQKVHKTENCWLWIGALNSGGYGHITINKKHMYAHRASYEFFNGLIPEGKQLDHLCRIRNCVNPEHLQPVTPGENIRRGARPTKTHCINGHEFTKENTFIYKKTQRKCRKCGRTNKRRRDGIPPEKYRIIE